MGDQHESPGEAELNRLAMTAGEQALALFRQFTREEVSAKELQTRLVGLGTEAIIARHWESLTAGPERVPCFEVLQLLSSLAGELEYQVERYGESSLWDDLTELQAAVRRLRPVEPR